MTFLSPSSLWLLFAICIPIIIHIFSRLKTKTVEFSSVRYIKQLEKIGIGKLFGPGTSINDSLEYIQKWVKNNK